MSLILLVRHGENEWVKKQRLAGWIPGVHLNEKGREQAGQVAERLAHLPVRAVYSSPLARCMETASYVADSHHLQIQELGEVGEVRYGRWEGKKIKKLAKKPEWYAVQHYPSRFRFPEGESFRDVQLRAISALESLAAQHQDETFVVVSHADIIKLVLAHYLGVHMDLFQRIGLSPASVSAILLPPQGGVRVLRINDDGPIQPPPEPKKEEDQAAKLDSEDRQLNSEPAMNPEDHTALTAVEDSH